jgi:hypothetical protein
MKTLIKIFSLIFLSSVIFYSCNDADLDVDDHAAGYSEGGLVRNDNPLVNYVIGSDQAYKFDMLIYQGAIKTTSIDIMKTFTTSTGLSSNTILLKNVEVTNNDTDFFSFATTYTELIAGLEINGEPLPASDSELAIADYWTLTYIAVTSEGNSHINGVTSKLAVATRLAGIYTVIDSEYFHPSGSQGPFNGVQRIIESIANEPDFATYLATDIAAWVDATNFYYFYVNNVADADGTFAVIIPKEYNGAIQLIWGADEIGLCQFNEIPDMPCTNYARLFEDGHDELFLNYGYIRSSGTRQFFENDIKN